MPLETFDQAEIVHLVQETLAGEALPPYAAHQTYQLAPEAVEVNIEEAATQPNAGTNPPNPMTNPPNPIVTGALARFLSRCDMKKYKQLGHTVVAILLFFTTVTVMLAANDMIVKEKVALYETIAMNSVAFMVIYLTTRLSIKSTSVFYNFNRAAEFVGIGISIFLFLASLLIYTDIVSFSFSDYNLILGIVCLVFAFGIEVIVLFLVLCFCCLK